MRGGPGGDGDHPPLRAQNRHGDADVRPPFEAARATGATFPQLARFIAIPEASNLLLSQLLYIFEYNVRASSILGFVGAGGISFYILRYLQLLQYDGVLTLLFVVFVTVVAIDLGSLAIRSRYLTRLPATRG